MSMHCMLSYEKKKKKKKKKKKTFRSRDFISKVVVERGGL